MLQYSQTNQLFGGFQARPTRPFFGLVWFDFFYLFLQSRDCISADMLSAYTIYFHKLKDAVILHYNCTTTRPRKSL